MTSRGSLALVAAATATLIVGAALPGAQSKGGVRLSG